MAETHEVELTVGGRSLTAWDEVILTHDLLTAGSALSACANTALLLSKPNASQDKAQARRGKSGSNMNAGQP